MSKHISNIFFRRMPEESNRLYTTAPKLTQVRLLGLGFQLIRKKFWSLSVPSDRSELSGHDPPREEAAGSGPQGTEGQAGGTAQVRVLGIPAAPSQLQVLVAAQGAQLGRVPAPRAAPRHLTLCLHPK